MIDYLESFADEFCESNYFLLLEPAVKEHGLGIIVEFLRQCRGFGVASPETFTIDKFEKVLFGAMAMLALPLEARKGIPALLAAFFSYLSDTGKYPPASAWEAWVRAAEMRYLQRFRENGSIKGETFTKKYSDVNRNDPCPCGSGKKFKKCCMKLIG